MHLNELDTVNRLNKVLKLSVEAYKQVLNMQNHIDEDPGGIHEHGIARGYGMNLSFNSDGSGPSATLNGCYVGFEILEATKAILLDRIRFVVVALDEHGVAADAEKIISDAAKEMYCDV